MAEEFSLSEDDGTKERMKGRSTSIFLKIKRHNNDGGGVKNALTLNGKYLQAKKARRGASGGLEGTLPWGPSDGSSHTKLRVSGSSGSPRKGADSFKTFPVPSQVTSSLVFSGFLPP